MSVRTFVPAGAPLHASPGDVASPLHEYFAGIVPPFVNPSLVSVRVDAACVVAAMVAALDDEAGVEVGALGALYPEPPPHAPKTAITAAVILIAAAVRRADIRLSIS
jgi:hypothetical protein